MSPLCSQHVKTSMGFLDTAVSALLMLCHMRVQEDCTGLKDHRRGTLGRFSGSPLQSKSLRNPRSVHQHVFLCSYCQRGTGKCSCHQSPHTHTHTHTHTDANTQTFPVKPFSHLAAPKKTTSSVFTTHPSLLNGRLTAEPAALWIWWMCS